MATEIFGRHSRQRTPLDTGAEVDTFESDPWQKIDAELDDFLVDDGSSRGARSPLPALPNRHRRFTPSPIGASPASSVCGPDSEDVLAQSKCPSVEPDAAASEVEDCNTAIEADGSSQSGRSREASVFSSRGSRPSSRATTPMLPTPGEAPKTTVAPWDVPDISIRVEMPPPSPSLKQSAALVACGVGATVGTLLIATHTRELWQPPVSHAARVVQQQVGAHVVNPLTEALSRGALWLSRFGYHPAPTPLPYDPLVDWREIATRFRRLDHLVQAGALAVDGREEL